MFNLAIALVLTVDSSFTENYPLYKMEEVVVTATKLSSLRKNVPVSVTVIDSDEIKNINAKDVTDILNYVSSIKVEKYGSMGSVSGILMRGLYSSQVLVLVDGRPINSPSLGMADLSWISAGNIKQIEIVRGPISSLYGSSAIAGVINIITRKPKKNNSCSFSYGSWNTMVSLIENSNMINALKYTITANMRNSDGARPNSEHKNSEITGTLEYNFKPGRISLQTGYYKSKTGSPGVKPPEDTADRQDTQKQLGNDEVSSLYDFGQNEKIYFNTSAEIYNFKLSGFLNNWDDNSYMEWISGFDPNWEHHIGTSNYKINFYGIEPQYSYKWKKMILTLGANVNKTELITTSMDSISSTDSVTNQEWKKTRTTIAAYLQDEIKLDPFRINIGCRAESTLEYPSQISPRASIVWMINKELRSSVVYGKGFRIPTLNDLYYPEDPFTEGNPNLKPEKSESYEAGMEWIKNFNDEKNIISKVWIFRQDTYDMIRWDAVGSIGPYGNKWTPSNINRVTTQGVETEIVLGLLKNLKCRFNYTYLNAIQKNMEITRADTLKLEEIERIAAYIPEHKLNVGLEYKTFYDLKISTGIGYVSETYNYYQIGWPIVTDTTKTLPAYTLLDLKVSKNWKIVECSFAVNNLLDSKYAKFGGNIKDENYPLPGRAFTVEARLIL